MNICTLFLLIQILRTYFSRNMYFIMFKLSDIKFLIFSSNTFNLHSNCLLGQPRTLVWAAPGCKRG